MARSAHAYVRGNTADFGVGRGEIGLQDDASHAILSAKGVGEVLQRIDRAGDQNKVHAADVKGENDRTSSMSASPHNARRLPPARVFGE